MKVSIGELKPKEDQKSPEPPKRSSGCTILLDFFIWTVVLVLGLFLMLKMWELHLFEDNVSGLESRIKGVEAEFQILTIEMGKTDRRISHIVHDMAQLADEFNRSTEQPPVKLQKQPASVNRPMFTFEKLTWSQMRHMMDALEQLLPKDEPEKVFSEQENDRGQRQNKNRETTFENFTWDLMKRTTDAILRLVPRDELDKTIIEFKRMHKKTMEENETHQKVPKAFLNSTWRPMHLATAALLRLLQKAEMNNKILEVEQEFEHEHRSMKNMETNFGKFTWRQTKLATLALSRVMPQDELDKGIVDIYQEMDQQEKSIMETTFENFTWSQYDYTTRALLQLLPKDELQKGIIEVKQLLIPKQKKAMETNESTTVPKRIRRDDSLTYPRRIRRAANSSDDSKKVDDFWYHYAGDAATSCKVPKKGLKTAEIRCKIWPQSIACNIYCVYGSAFPEGILRTLNCSFHTNRWSDYFEECQPFVNCKVHLIGPGTLKCIDNRVNQSPSCNIGCEEYEDHDATKPRTYDCKANGTWDPPLPPCVAKKNGTDLIRAPNVLEHKTIEYPKG